MEALYQKYFFDEHFPFDVFIADTTEFPPHWHKDFEVVYNLGSDMDIGIHDKVYHLKCGDIFIVGANDIHYFPPVKEHNERIILQFNADLLGMYTDFDKGMRFESPMISKDGIPASVHTLLEKQILAIQEENSGKANGYKMSIMARLYDIMTLLVRNIPMVRCTEEELSHTISRLGRLEKVFLYVESSYNKKITLDKIADIAGYSSFHFTRFFKSTTGMTFITYLNNFRIYQATVLLDETEEMITEIAYSVGFESVKTFNRVFKELKGCSPTAYRKQNMRSQ